jgi:hypothetical protein
MKRRNSCVRRSIGFGRKPTDALRTRDDLSAGGFAWK